MSFLHHSFRLLLAVSVMMLPAIAQVDSANSDQQTDNPPAPPRRDNSGAPPAAEGNWLDLRSMVLALGDRGNNWLDDLAGRGLLFGVSSSEGYGWTRGPAFESSSGAISVMQPYLGFFEGGHLTKVVFQYAPTIDVYNGHGWGGGAFQRASVDGRRVLTRNLTWTFSGLTTYGKESLRQLAGLAFTPGGGTPGFLTFASPLSSSVLVVSGSTALNWARTPRQQFSFTLGDAYGSVEHSVSRDAVSARAEMTNPLGRQAAWQLYTQVHDYLDQKGCVAYGAGAGINSAVGERINVAVEGGPQFGGSGCGSRVSAFFAGSLDSRLSTRTKAYLTAKRELLAPYLTSNKWADSFSVRLKQQTTQTTFLEASTSYVRSTSAGEAVPAYAAVLVSSAFHWRATHAFSLVGSYRYFKRNPAFANPLDRHNWVFLTLEWQPTSRSSQQ